MVSLVSNNNRIYETLEYVQKGNYFDDVVKIDIAIDTGNTDTILLIVPGIDGAIDGYADKYKKIANGINRKYGATVIRMSNPHNMMGDHCRNLLEVLDYIEKHYDMKNKKLYAMGHSLGAYMIGTVANRYNYIDKILLINPATKLDQKELSNMQARKKNKNIVLVGNKDGSYEYRNKYSEYAKVHIVMNADHHFSGESLKNFISAADMYLFRRTPFLFLRQLARLEKE